MATRKSFQATCLDGAAFAAFAAVRPCYRHTMWIAHCDDCTAWRLPAARRNSHHA